ncbi:hypothetical protein M231_01490 [Tremella mesenterica]|uniref:DNA replication regulator SLD2 n=1 Tax=Tremella mesenterica TaxID=5217 RepID=A0A4Q1BTL9_TREME|nr:hypothetical protein M231_01490 [Tremella mesenterica]
MDLVTIKAAVKAWEKAFKVQNGRNPTKEDIKSDPGGIGEQYALYRRLSKSNVSQSQGSSLSNGQHASTSSSITSSSSRNGITITPQSLHVSQYPTTPTPPSRRTQTSFDDITNESGPSRAPGESINGEKKSLKRTASKAILNPHSPPSLQHSNSKKNGSVTPRKPYSGPIHDPNPINPFSIPSPAKQEIFSPFIHASSPRRLKQVLEMNSLRKIKERSSVGHLRMEDKIGEGKEITPRTRARKRLRGELVDDTPMKEPRRRRGERMVSNGSTNGNTSDISVSGFNDRNGKEEEDEEEFGPSPMKLETPKRGRSFTSLFEPVEEKRNDPQERNGNMKNRGRPSEMLGLFAKASMKGKEKETGLNHKVSSPISMKHSALPLNDLPISALNQAQEQVFKDRPEMTPLPINGLLDEEPLPIPPLDPDMNPSPSVINPIRVSRPVKTLSLSDDEKDEWDPEGGPSRHAITIVPTRHPIRVRHRSSSSSPKITYKAGIHLHTEEEEIDEEDDPGDAAEEEEEEMTLDSSTLHSPTPNNIFTLLSLRSPLRKRRDAIDNLRVKALFDPEAAVKLKAVRKGQEVHVAGDLNGADDTEGDDEVEEGGMDDDWESEDEGWKRDVEDEDDEVW